MQAASPKTPGEVLDYTIDYYKELEPGEAIATSTWALSGQDESLALGEGSYAATNDDTSVTLWLTNGTAEVTYTATNYMATDATPPRVFERSFEIFITEKVSV